MDNLKIQNYILEIVNSFCCLGVTIRYNGNINASSSLLVEKGRKAYFKIKKCVGFDCPCSLLDKLFDSFVSLIILYCSALLGVESTWLSKILIHMHIITTPKIYLRNSWYSL